MSDEIGGMMEIAVHAGVTVGGKPGHRPEKLLAQEFEALFLAQMWKDAASVEHTPAGPASHGEQVFRAMLLQEQAVKIARSGGIGLAGMVEQGMTR